MDDRHIREQLAKERYQQNTGIASEPMMDVAAEFDPTWDQGRIERQFTYHAPSAAQRGQLALIREAGKMLALTILAQAPPSHERDSAIMGVRVAVMVANSAIVAGK